MCGANAVSQVRLEFSLHDLADSDLSEAEMARRDSAAREEQAIRCSLAELSDDDADKPSSLSGFGAAHQLLCGLAAAEARAARKKRDRVARR